MSAGTIFWILLLVVGPLSMVFMHRRRQGPSEQDAAGHRHRGC